MSDGMSHREQDDLKTEIVRRLKPFGIYLFLITVDTSEDWISIFTQTSKDGCSYESHFRAFGPYQYRWGKEIARTHLLGNYEKDNLL